MKQGASRAKLSERKDDLYETPASAIRTLIRNEKLPHDIWEPCAGRGAISRELIAAGHRVIRQDLVAYPGADDGITSGIDFLMETKAPLGVSCIVTNPPYKLADQFIRHGISLGCDVVVLLRLMALEGTSRSDIIDEHLVRVWAGIERLPMMHREGWEGERIAVAGVPFAWFVFSAAKRHAGFPIQLHRMSWGIA